MVGSSVHTNNHHYAIDVAKLVEKCRSLLHSILSLMKANSSERAFQRRSVQLVTLADALKCVDRLIHTHLLDLLDREMEFLSSINESDIQKKAQLHQFFGEHTEFPTLMDTVKTLQSAERVSREYRHTSNICVVGHNRSHSTSILPDVVGSNAFLSIEDPIEEGGNNGGWYFGGRRSPSPPPSPILQSAGETSPPQPGGNHRRALSLGGTAGVAPLPTLPMATTPSSPIKHSRSNKYCPTRTAKDSTLFRLIVSLQLCLIRIEEANSVLCKGQARAAVRCTGRSRSGSFLDRGSSSNIDLRACSSGSHDGIQASVSEDSEMMQQSSFLVSSEQSGKGKAWRLTQKVIIASIAIGGAYLLSYKSKESTRSNDKQTKLLAAAGKATAGMATASFIRKRWRILCMNARVANSADVIEDWIFHWICLVNDSGSDTGLLAPRKSAFWYSNGSIRFQLMKRGMDLLYASIGKAVEITRGPQDAAETSVTNPKSSGLWTYVVASLAASYYNVIGPAAKSASSLANAPSSVIQDAWGLVSLPAVKKASLEATRILKGAAIADRIEICGVSCFVLSREPFPALASALRRYRRQQNREDVRLGTIHESLTSHSSSVNVRGFQKRDLILHLTGGGFFAHTIAGDLPYLLDWSSTSKSVVVIPEYALFPRTFPDALNEVSQIYRSLCCGQAATLLGFQPDRIIVSGESVGGNLAAALCVTLITEYEEGQCVELTPRRSTDLVNDLEDEPFYSEVQVPAGDFGSESRYMGLELPDALMLCCPALNLSLESTPSRIDGANDPVLPSALIATISNSYRAGCPVTHPRASPYYASDEIIRNFPTTLIYTSSEDPFLDDAVAFNGRLRNVGVKSNLRAVHDLPHAFWALATAGIPEARQVQREIELWLGKIFA